MVRMYSTPGLDRSYENAISIINGRRRQSRPKAATSAEKSGSAMPTAKGAPDLKGTPSIVGMKEWLQMLGHSEEDLNALSVIHIAGTKGKGSTCAFIESFLRAHGQRTGFPRRIGMYTSPHLILPEERIRINFEPLAPARFVKYFFEIYDKLPQLASEYDLTLSVVERGPRFLQLYALFAFHVFIREVVDAVILETHSGGEYDATNVVQRPIVTAITTLGMDHVEMLGPSIQNIAWHKSGIFKPGAMALSTIQDLAPANVLTGRARDKGLEVRFIDQDKRLPTNALQLKPYVQRKNASLAVAAAEAFLSQKSPPGLHSLDAGDIRTGIDQWSWPGRFQIVPDGRQTWFLDAAHNDMSVQIAAEWFADSGADVCPSATRVLIFSHISELRDAPGLFRSLMQALEDQKVQISNVIFTNYNEDVNEKGTEMLRPDVFHEISKYFYPETTIWDEPTITRAIHRANDIAKRSSTGLQTLVTGSQHLVGPALRIIQSHKGT